MSKDGTGREKTDVGIKVKNKEPVSKRLTNMRSLAITAKSRRVQITKNVLSPFCDVTNLTSSY